MTFRQRLFMFVYAYVRAYQRLWCLHSIFGPSRVVIGPHVSRTKSLVFRSRALVVSVPLGNVLSLPHKAD